MVLNTNDTDANISLDFYFEDKDPEMGVKIKVAAKRVKCFRMDFPVGEQKMKIPFGQYSLVVNSDVPAIVNFGRLDRRKDMAYYSVQGFSA